MLLSLRVSTEKIRIPAHVFFRSLTVIAFDKERVHSAIEIDIFGLCIHRLQSAPRPPSFTFCLACSCACLVRWNVHEHNLGSIDMVLETRNSPQTELPLYIYKTLGFVLLSLRVSTEKIRIPAHVFFRSLTVIAFDKERVHSAIEIDIFGLCIHRLQSAPRPPSFTFCLACSCACLVRWNVHEHNLGSIDMVLETRNSPQTELPLSSFLFFFLRLSQI